MLRRILTPLALSTLLVALWFGESALCSCGGPPQPAPAEPAPPALAPLPEPAPASDTLGDAPVLPPEPAPRPDFSDPSWTHTPSATGAFVVVWRPTPAPIPRNEDFTLEAWLLFDGTPKHVTELGVSAWMPDHGHGMLRKMKPEAQPDGSYRITNLLLHMRGHWLLIFDVLEGTLAERAEHALELR